MLSRGDIESLGFEFVATECSDLHRDIYVNGSTLLIYKTSAVKDISEVTIKENHRTIFVGAISDLRTLESVLE